MAGESPDRAGQRESSGVATAQQVADPKLAVFREADDADDTDVVDGATVTAKRSDELEAEREMESAAAPAADSGDEPAGSAEPAESAATADETPADADADASSGTGPEATAVRDPAEATPADVDAASGDEPAGPVAASAPGEGASAGSEAPGKAPGKASGGSSGRAGAQRVPAAPKVSAESGTKPAPAGPADTGAAPDDEAAASAAPDAVREPADEPDGPVAASASASADAVRDPADGEAGEDADSAAAPSGSAPGEGASAGSEAPGKAPGKASGGSSGRAMALRAPTAPKTPAEPATSSEEPAEEPADAPGAPATEKTDKAAPAPAPATGGSTADGPGAPRGDRAVVAADKRALAPEPPGAPRVEKEASGSAGNDGEEARSVAAGRPRQDGPAAEATDGPAPVPEAAPRERTKQMPLPPAPAEPLKLLAALTNTPPPPQTPIRTAFRRLKIWTPLVVLLLIVLGTAQLLRPLPAPALTLTAVSSYTFDGDSPSLPWPSEGQAAVEVDGLGSLGSSGEQTPVPIASVTKVMTAYLILRDHPVKEGADGETVPVDQTAEDQYESGLAESESVVEVKKGDKLSEYEALEHILISSANNVARLVARWDAGSEKAFVEKMNAAAEDLGMKNTTYTDPSGLDEATVSTAKDQVKLGRAAMEDSVFREIATKIQYTASTGKVYTNWNQLAGYNDVVGIKTGTTTKAGGNLLFAATKEVNDTEQMIIGAVLGQHTPSILDTVLARSKELILATQDLITSDEVIKKGDVVGYVDDGLGGRTPVVATKDVTAVGWAGLEVDIATEAGKAGIPNEAKAGTEVGTLTVGSGPGQVKVPVALESALTEPSYGARLTRVG